MIWEYTSTWVVLTANARTMSEGAIVSVRRASRGMCQFMKPGRTT